MGNNKCKYCNGSGLWYHRFASSGESCPHCHGSGDIKEGECLAKKREIEWQESQCEYWNREPHICWQEYPLAAERMGIPKPEMRNGKTMCECCNVPWKYCEEQ